MIFSKTVNWSFKASYHAKKNLLLHMRSAALVFQQWGSQKKVVRSRIFDDSQTFEKPNAAWSKMRYQFSPCNEIHLLIPWVLIVSDTYERKFRILIFKMKLFLRKSVFLTFPPYIEYFCKNPVLSVFCPRMDILRHQKLKNHMVD